MLYTNNANLEKILPLAAVNAVSKKDLDDAIGREASAKAAVRKSEIDLSFTKITSPINGIAKAQLGDLVGNPAAPELKEGDLVEVWMEEHPDEKQQAFLSVSKVIHQDVLFSYHGLGKGLQRTTEKLQ